MVSSYMMAFLLVCFLLLNLWSPTPTAADNFLPPLLSPAFDDVCKEVECGKGTCKASQNSTFSFVCECQPGWKQGRLDSDHGDGLRFLPCVIPNCTLDYTCSKEPSSVAQNKEKPSNYSIFDPCGWSYCGGGTCNKTSLFTHTCDCEAGYSNLLNVSTFPCIRDCALGLDCSDLGINVMNNSSPATPALADNTNNQGRINVQGYFSCLVWISMVALALADL